jgi:hypothetical protein
LSRSSALRFSSLDCASSLALPSARGYTFPVGTPMPGGTTLTRLFLRRAFHANARQLA